MQTPSRSSHRQATRLLVALGGLAGGALVWWSTTGGVDGTQPPAQALIPAVSGPAGGPHARALLSEGIPKGEGIAKGLGIPKDLGIATVSWADGEDAARPSSSIERLQVGALTLEVAQGEMLIELHPQVDRQERAQLWAQAGVEVLDYIPGLGLYRVRVQGGADLAGALAAMGRRPEVSHVGPNPVARGAASQAQGIDPQAAAALQILDEGLLDQMSELPSLSAIEAPALLSLMWYAAGHSRLQPDGWPTAPLVPAIVSAPRTARTSLG